jgi:putative endopeptidase
MGANLLLRIQLFTIVAFLTLASFAQQPTSQVSRSQDIDHSVKPGQDFYRFANGNWLKTAAPPAGQTNLDIRAMLMARNAQRVRDLIEKAAASRAANGAIEQKVSDYYASYMDQAAIESKGLAPLADSLSRISAITDRTSLSAYLGTTLGSEIDGLTSNSDHIFGIWINQGFDDASHNLPHLWQGGLGLPNRDDYLDSSQQKSELRSQYQAHIARVLKLAGAANAEREAPAVLSLEIGIARAFAPDSDAADTFKQNNPWKRADFAQKAPALDWNAYFQAAGLSAQQNFIVWQPSDVVGVSALVRSEDIDVWKNYLRLHLFDHYASVLPNDVSAEHAAFFNAVSSSGGATKSDREADAIAATNGALGLVVGQLYTRQYFPPEAKAKAQSMVRDLLAAYRERIPKLAWMSPETKQKALAKLAALQVIVGYPDEWIDYSSLEIVRGDALGNIRRAESFNRSRDLRRLQQPVNPIDWPINPQQPGAVIMFSPNAEFFTAGILQPPYFDPDGDTASNYGSAGAAMAHEISHSFDELGNIYDAQGRLSDWWTATDRANYHAATSKLADQMSAYCPLPDLCVNGKQVLSESVADLTGLEVAHDAYILSLKGKPDSTIDGQTGDQRFFLAFAQRWRKIQPEPALRRQIQTDTHPPAEYRSDTVRNIDAWYAPFKITPTDKLYLDPSHRIRIW